MKPCEAHCRLAAVYSLRNVQDLSIESLQRAVTLDERWIEYARTSGDFDNVRGSLGFQQLINSQPTREMR